MADKNNDGNELNQGQAKKDEDRAKGRRAGAEVVQEGQQPSKREHGPVREPVGDAKEFQEQRDNHNSNI